MSQQQKDIFNRYLDEIWNKGDLSNAEEMLTSNFVQHAPGRDIEGLEAFKQYQITRRYDCRHPRTHRLNHNAIY